MVDLDSKFIARVAQFIVRFVNVKKRRHKKALEACLWSYVLHVAEVGEVKGTDTVPCNVV